MGRPAQAWSPARLQDWTAEAICEVATQAGLQLEGWQHQSYRKHAARLAPRSARGPTLSRQLTRVSPRPGPPLPPLLQTLTTNGLRERVALRCDGGMRNGRDVLVTAALGADEYGFGTVSDAN